MELAQAFLRLGSAVTLIETLEPLGREDPELAAIVLRRLAADGLRIYDRTGVVAARKGGDGIEIDLKTGAQEWTISGTHLLVATGRRPDLDDRELDAARIRRDDRGVRVNRGLRTSNRRVYAIGDAAGGMQFTHVAGYQGGLVVRNALFGLPVRAETDISPGQPSPIPRSPMWG